MNAPDSLFIQLARTEFRPLPFAGLAPCPPATDAEPLTERERDILIMTSLGLCNKVISRRMNISVRTVENHRSSLRRKLGTGTVNRMAAMMQAILHTSSERLAELLDIDARTADRQLAALRGLPN